MVQFHFEVFPRLFSKTLVGALVVSQVFYTSSFAEVPRYKYVSIHGDTLSDIVWALVPGKLYGPNGNLSRVEKLNPELKNPNLLLPGNSILLPDGSRYQIEKISRINGDSFNQNFKNKNLVNSRLTEIDRVIAGEKSSEENNTESTPKIESEFIHESAVNKSVIEKTESVNDPTLSSKNSSSSAFLRKSTLELSPFYRINAITMSDSGGRLSTVGSKIYPGLNINYIQAWTKSFQSYIHLNFGYVSFEAPKALSTTLENSDHFLSGIGIGTRFKLSEPLELDLLASFKKELFGRATSTTSLSVDTVSVPSIRAQAYYELINLEPFKFGVAPIAQYYFSTQVTSNPVRQGTAIGGTLYFKQDVSRTDSNFMTEVGFLKRTQNSFVVNQSETTLFLNMRFNFEIGRKQRDRKGED